MEDDRIETTRNRVFVRELAFGKDSPIAMKTNDNFVYRVTGMDQVEDIITSGYARSKDKVKDGQMGAISLEDLTAIWIFNEKENRYVNCIEYYRCLREELLSSKGKSRR